MKQNKQGAFLGKTKQ